ncbi:MAG: M48 family metalloprotease, partial [Synechococcales bacterium]|nr:M48 family metalloprotease [Synechococcales bacterium]
MKQPHFWQQVRRLKHLGIAIATAWLMIWLGMPTGLAIDRFQTLVQADELYQKGQTQAATTLYRKVKPDFPTPEKRRNAIYDVAKLPGDAQVFWRTAQEGLSQNLATKVFVAGHRLVQNYPEFIEGYLLMAKACKQMPEECKNQAKAGQPKTALEFLERGTDLYGDDPVLLKAKIAELRETENFLEASITARQFATIYPDASEAPEFIKLADENFKKYQSRLNGQLRTQGILTGILGLVKAFQTSDWRAGVSGFQTLSMMAKGESEFGKAIADKMVQQYREQGKLVENPQLLNYAKGIAAKLEMLAGRSDFQYELYLVEDSSLNAFMLPGGKMFVHTEAISAAQSEAELAGLFGHEIAHAVLSHGFQKVANANFMANLSQVVPVPKLIQELAIAQYSQESERQSDVLGTRLLGKAGYAADGLRNLMATLNAGGNDRKTDWRATHPAPAERVQYLEELIQQNGYNRYAYEGVKPHAEMKAAMRGGSSSSQPIATNPSSTGQTSLGDGSQSGQPKKPTATKAPKVKLGVQPIVASQVRDNVEVRLEKVKVSSARNVTITFTIDNRSNQSFGFVPMFAAIEQENGKKLSTRFSNEVANVPANTKVTGEVMLVGHSWKPDEPQELTLVIKESTQGSRLFRIGF